MKTIKWTYEKCKEEASKYKTRKELREKNKSLCSTIQNNKWYELFDHMEIIGNKCKRLVYVYEFPDNSCYIGLTYNITVRNNQHISYNNNSAVRNHIEKTNLIPKLVLISNYIEINESIDLEEKTLLTYKGNGWNILNKAKTGNTGGNLIKWNKENCIEEIKKYKTLKDFIEKSPSAYVSCIKNGWIDELCEDLRKITKKKKYDNKELCKIESMKYGSRTEFSNKCWSGYNYAKLNGWIDEFFPRYKKRDTL
jgi:predicted GIY-YIG superfamily endonuclease